MSNAAREPTGPTPGTLSGLVDLVELPGDTSCVVEGLVPIGGACISDVECQGDTAWCDAGRCAPAYSEGELGCVTLTGGHRSRCEADLVCTKEDSPFVTTGRCDRRGVGSPCLIDRIPACPTGTYCDAGTCVPVDERERALGETCGAATPRCTVALACVGGLCVEAFGEGEPCTHVDSCSEGLACAASVCRRYPRTGEPCLSSPTDVEPFYCSGLLYCNDGLCADQSANGASCDLVSDSCISYWCDDGVCTVPPVVVRD
jgi:hypothetical protein